MPGRFSDKHRVGGFRQEFETDSDRRGLDEESPNPGKQLLEKMVSGLYLGELVRVGVLHELARKNNYEPGEFPKIEIPPILLKPHCIDTADVSNILSSPPDTLSPFLRDIRDPLVHSLLSEVSECVLDRSAAVAAAVLAAVIQKATLGRPTARCEVGIDGSLFTKGHKYKQRLLGHLSQLMPEEDFNQVFLDFSEDGSGLGAALVAAAIARGKQVENIHMAAG